MEPTMGGGMIFRTEPGQLQWILLAQRFGKWRRFDSQNDSAQNWPFAPIVAEKSA
jgi:hypothetical protein